MERTVDTVSKRIGDSFIEFTQKNLSTPWKRKNYVVVGWAAFESFVKEIRNDRSKFKRTITMAEPFSMKGDRYQATEIAFNSFPIVIDTHQENEISFVAID